MKLISVMVAFAALFPFAQSAQAQGHLHQNIARHDAWGFGYAVQGEHRYRYAVQSTPHYPAPSEWHGPYGARPAEWCGWEMRQLVSRDPGPEFNLARNWAHWGHAASAGVGAVVVWPHHVGKIVGREDGMWVIKSGNDDNMVRSRPLSIAGAIAIRRE